MKRKVYTHRSEKVIDFFAGLLLVPFVMVLTWALMYSVLTTPAVYIATAPFFIELGLAIFISIMRKFFGFGFLVVVAIAVMIPLVLLGACSLGMFGSGTF